MNDRTPRYLRLLCLLAVGGVLLTAGASQTANPPAKSEKDWKIIGGVVQPDTYYSLYSLSAKSSLRHGHQTWGISLDWDSTPQFAGKNIMFQLKDKKGTLRNNSVVAILVQGGGYLRHDHRVVGANLSYSNTAVFEWVIGVDVGGVQSNVPISLYNQQAKGYLAYEHRRFGVSIGWIPFRQQQ